MRQDDHGDAFVTELESALSDAFAVDPDPFRQVAVRAQVIAELREINSATTVQGALSRVYDVQPSASRYNHYRQLAIAAASEPVPEKESLLTRAMALFRGGDHVFERRLNDCIDAIVSGRATTNECLQRYPQDADRLAPLLGMAFELRSEYASLPFEQRLSGVRWRIQRASQVRETTPLAAQPAGGGFFRNLQWAAPLTTGVAASFLLGFLVFQAYLGDDGATTSPQAGNPQFAEGEGPLSFGALNEVTSENQYLSRFQSSIERVQTAVINEQPPAAEDIEALTQRTSELQEQIEAGGLEGEERRAAVTLADTAASALEAAESLVEGDQADLLVTSQELIDQLNSAIASTALPGGDSDEGEAADPEPTAEPTEEPADDDEQPADDGDGEGSEDEEVDLVELVDTHRALSEQLAAGVVLDRALFRAYRQSLNDLQEAIESEEGAADEEFLTTTLELLGLDEVSLNALLESDSAVAEQLTEAQTRRTEVFDLAEGTLSELQNPDDEGEEGEEPPEERN